MLVQTAGNFAGDSDATALSHARLAPWNSSIRVADVLPKKSFVRGLRGSSKHFSHTEFKQRRARSIATTHDCKRSIESKIEASCCGKVS